MGASKRSSAGTRGPDVVVVVVARCVDVSAVDAALPGAVVVQAEDFNAAADALDRRPGIIISPVGLVPGSSTSGLTLAGMARARRVPCVLVDRYDAEDIAGAAVMRPRGDLAAAVSRARALRG